LHNIRFAYVHLKSAFLSQQEEFKDVSEKLYSLSRFDYVENLIISEVCKNGSFYKLKAFSDIVVVPIVNAVETLFKQSAENYERATILINKGDKFKKWTEIFKSDSERRIESFLTNLSGKLKREISSFAEDNYDNPNASSEWDKILKHYDIERKAIDLLKQFGQECESELKEISREINSELKFSHSVFSDNSINMPTIYDGKRIWNWTTTLLSGGIGVFGLLNIWNPVGWVSIAASVGVALFSWLGSLFFDDREQKARDARQKLENKLNDYVDKMIKDLRKNMLDSLSNILIKKQLLPMQHTIDNVIHSMLVLSKTQRKFAIRLNSRLEEINKAVIKEALEYLGYAGLEWHISGIARIPGYAYMLILEEGKIFPNDATKNLSNLLNEKGWYIIKNDRIKSMLLQAIWRKADRTSIDVQKITIQNIDNELQIAHIPFLDTIDANTKNRVRMAQQITELLIMK
jgi:hypothetical protein